MTRAADVPIGRIRASGYGVQRAAARVHWYVLYEGPQTVFVDDSGRVLCAPDGGAAERRLLTSHTAWCVGHFVGSSDRRRAADLARELIAENLRVRAAELCGVAA